MLSTRTAGPIDHDKLVRIADGLVVAVAVSLPLSTSATSILVVLWLIALIPTLSWPEARRVLMSPAGGLPVVLVALGIVGMTWADVPLDQRWEGVSSFFKLLAIPLLICQFERSDRGRHVFAGFLIACVVLLVGSYLVTVYPTFPLKIATDNGVLVKSYIVQSAEFMLCAAVLAHLSIDGVLLRQWRYAVMAAALSVLFLVDIFFVATSRTTLVVIPVLALVYAARRWGWKGLAATCVAGLIAAAAIWGSSTYLRDRVGGVLTEIQAFEAQNIGTPSGERLTFWTKSIGFIKESPLIGHGTGSITEMFRRAAIGETGARADVSTNPHNQTFAVAIQLGLLGAIALWAMWIAHLLAFKGSSWAAWAGFALVLQTIVASLFNTFLFDFTEGWIYVFGVGVAAGMVRRGKRDSGVSAVPGGVAQ